MFSKLKKFFVYKFFYSLIFLILFKSKFLANGKFLSRRYFFNSYKIYLFHQKLKFFFYKKDLEKNFDLQTKLFYNHFKFIFTLNLFKKPHNASCLAARTGAEVKALRDLGVFSVGFDLVYPKKSPYVLYGDFHNLQCNNDTFDLTYCNALDHVYELSIFFKEVYRITKPQGIIIFDIQKGKLEREIGSMVGTFETQEWLHSLNLIEYIKKFNLTLLKTFDKELNSNITAIFLKN